MVIGKILLFEGKRRREILITGHDKQQDSGTKNLGFLGLGFSKKGQLKIQEMSFMLVAVLLFFILAGLFAFSIYYANLSKQASEIKSEEVISIVNLLADSPEFSCSGSKSNCVDGDKLVNLLNKKNYQNFWPFSSLSVVKLGALNKSSGDIILCTRANYPNCDEFVIYDKSVKESSVSNFVALCRKESVNNYVYEDCEVVKFIAGVEDDD
ncbi:hypothetical protein HOD75_04865 [archaeon]|nr:hypothetical protein [archaeon]MBT4242196.1 hypothetical protein [archaeon]MBT4417884.1 hypothetical protein [archaeon]